MEVPAPSLPIPGIGQAASRAAEFASDVVNRVTSTASSLASKVADTASGLAREIVDKVGGVVEGIRDVANEAISAAMQTLANAAKEAGEIVSRMLTMTSSVVNRMLFEISSALQGIYATITAELGLLAQFVQDIRMVVLSSAQFLYSEVSTTTSWFISEYVAVIQTLKTWPAQLKAVGVRLMLDRIHALRAIALAKIRALRHKFIEVPRNLVQSLAASIAVRQAVILSRIQWAGHYVSQGATKAMGYAQNLATMAVLAGQAIVNAAVAKVISVVSGPAASIVRSWNSGFQQKMNKIKLRIGQVTMAGMKLVTKVTSLTLKVVSLSLNRVTKMFDLIDKLFQFADRSAGRIEKFADRIGSNLEHLLLDITGSSAHPPDGPRIDHGEERVWTSEEEHQVEEENQDAEHNSRHHAEEMGRAGQKGTRQQRGDGPRQNRGRRQRQGDLIHDRRFAREIAERVQGGVHHPESRAHPDGPQRNAPQFPVRDGDMTGPFYPGSWGPQPPMSPAEAMHGPNRATLFVNGIDTSIGKHMRSAQALADQTNRPVVGIYNQSSGLAKDFMQCATDKVGVAGFGERNKATQTLRRLVNEVGDARTPGGGLDIYAHSQGSIIVSEALREARGDGAKLNKIDVTTFGNAAFTMPDGLKSERHFVFDSDFVSGTVGSTSAIGNLITGNPYPILSAIMGVGTAVGRILREAARGNLIGGLSRASAGMFGGMFGSVGGPIASLMGMHPTTDHTYVLHTRSSGIRPHGITNEVDEDAHGRPRYDDAESYISALPRFEQKQRSQDMLHSILPAPLRPVVRAVERVLSPIRSGASMAFNVVRMIGGGATSAVGGAYGMVGRAVSAVEHAAERATANRYNAFDRRMRFLGGGLESVGRTAVGRAIQAGENAGHVARQTATATYRSTDRAVRQGASRAEGNVRNVYNASDARIRRMGNSVVSAGTSVANAVDRTLSLLPANPITNAARDALGMTRRVGSGIADQVSGVYNSSDRMVRNLGTAASRGVQAGYQLGTHTIETVAGAVAGRVDRAFQRGANAARNVTDLTTRVVSGAYNSADAAVRDAGAMASRGIAGAGQLLDWGARSVGSAVTSAGEFAAGIVDTGFDMWNYLQRSGTGPYPDLNPGVLRHNLLQAGGLGRSLDAPTRDNLSSLVGGGTEQARIHTGPQAAQAASALHAQAFTIGRDVFFGAGKYDPASIRGQALLAHELTHVVQQTGGIPSAMFYSTAGGDAMEAQARAVERRVLAGETQSGELLVRQHEKHYVQSADLPISQGDMQRLDRLGAVAIERAGEILEARHSGIQLNIADLEVQCDLDLNHMTDEDASHVWAMAIVDAIERQSVSRMHQQIEVQRAWEDPEGHFNSAELGFNWRLARDTRTYADDETEQYDLNITVMGEHFGRVSKGEAMRALRNSYRQIAGRVTSGAEALFDFTIFRREHWFTGAVSDTLAWQSIPPMSIWNRPCRFVREAYAALMARDVPRTFRKLAEAQQACTECEHQLYEYREGTISGAERAITGLEVTRDVCAVAVGALATVATGGAAGGIIVGGLYAGGQQVAEQATEVSLGLRDHVDWAGIAFDTTLNIVIGFATAGLGNRLFGWALRNPAIANAVRRTITSTVVQRLVASGVGRAIAQRIGSELTQEAVEAILRRAIANIIQDIVTGRLSAAISTACRGVFDRWRGERPNATYQAIAWETFRTLFDVSGALYDTFLGHVGRAAHGHAESVAREDASRRSEAAATEERRRRSRDAGPTEEGAPIPSDDAPRPTTADSGATVGDGPRPAATDTPPPAPAPSTGDGTPRPPENPSRPGVDSPHASPDAAPHGTVDGNPHPAPEGSRPPLHESPRPPGPVDEPPRARGPADEPIRSPEEETRRTPVPEATRNAIESFRRSPTPENALLVIRELRNWRGQVHELSASLTPDHMATIDRARRTLVHSLQEQIRQTHPELADIIFDAPGSARWNSDIDIGVRPSEERVRSATTPEAVAREIERCGRAADELSRLLREAMGGTEPDQALDTNVYPWTGVDAPLAIPPDQASAYRRAWDIGGLAELIRGMRTGDAGHAPADAVAAMEGEIMRRLTSDAPPDSAQGRFEAQAREHVRAQFEEARRIAADIEGRISAEAERLRGTDSSMTESAARVRAMEAIQAQLRADLLRAMSASPPDFGLIARIQAQMLMAAPGAYGTRAGISDVVGFQQPLANAADSPFHTMVDGVNGPIPISEGARQYMERMGARGLAEAAQSAASSLGQFEAHVHEPTTRAQAMDLLKQAFKYSRRVEFAERLGGAESERFPEMDGHTRDTLGPMLEAWARERGMPIGTDAEFMRGAYAFANEMLGRAREAQRGLYVRSVTGDLAGVDARSARAPAAAGPSGSAPASGPTIPVDAPRVLVVPESGPGRIPFLEADVRNFNAQAEGLEAQAREATDPERTAPGMSPEPSAGADLLARARRWREAAARAQAEIDQLRGTGGTPPPGTPPSSSAPTASASAEVAPQSDTASAAGVSPAAEAAPHSEAATTTPPVPVETPPPPTSGDPAPSSAAEPRPSETNPPSPGGPETPIPPTGGDGPVPPSGSGTETTGRSRARGPGNPEESVRTRATRGTGGTRGRRDPADPLSEHHEPPPPPPRPHPREFARVRAEFPGRGGEAGWKDVADLEHVWDRHGAGTEGAPGPTPDRLPEGARPPGSEHPPAMEAPSQFPADWTIEDIARTAAEVANDPNSTRVTRQDGSINVEGIRNGVRIRVRLSPDGRRILTTHPVEE